MRETAETKNIEKPDNFKNIRPENGTTKEDVRDFLDRAFFGEKEESVPEAKAETAAEPEKNDDGEKGVSDTIRDHIDGLKSKIDDVVDDLKEKIEDIKDDIKESKEFKDYIKDLKSRSECPETISDDVIDKSKWERRSTEETQDMHDKFDGMRERLIKEWEKINGREWPRYKEDVYAEDGVTILKHAGQRYDAHHIQPLSLGGENVASNITPLDEKNHKEIHKKGGSCKVLQDRFGKGGQS